MGNTIRPTNAMYDMCMDPSKTDSDIIQTISAQGYNPYYMDAQNYTILMRVCEQNRPDIAIALLTFTSYSINRTNKFGKDALYISVENGMQEVAMFILNTGLSRPACHPTLFSMACSNKMYEVAMWILAHEIPIVYPWAQNSSPLYSAFVHQMPEVASALVDHPSCHFMWDNPILYSFALKLAIFHNMPGVAMQILDKNKYHPCLVDASVENGELDPPTEAEYKNIKIRLPCSTGGNKKKMGFTWGYIIPDAHLDRKSALTWAYLKKMKDVFALLYFTYFQDIRCMYGNKSTLMMLCHLGMEKEAIAFLTDSRAIPEFKNNCEETALMFAHHMNLEDFVKLCDNKY